MTIANFRMIFECGSSRPIDSSRMILFQIETDYEKSDWRSKELKKFLYYLPLELKILIFQLVILKNMISWEIDHKVFMWTVPSKAVNIKTNFHFQVKRIRDYWLINALQYCKDEKDVSINYNDKINHNASASCEFSCLDIIEKTGYHNMSVFQYGQSEKCIKVEQKFTNKLCRPIKVFDNNIGIKKKFLIDEKIEYHHIDKDKLPEDILDAIQCRHVHIDGKESNKFWTENNCRCFTCDLVRYSYRKYAKPNDLPSKIWKKEKRIDFTVTNKNTNKTYGYRDRIQCYDWFKTYDNLIVDLEKKQWKTIY